MPKIFPLLAIGAVLALAGCASSTQQAALQLPGETTRSGLQVPPDLDERPPQKTTTAALQGR
jgi:hypothetical protein